MVQLYDLTGDHTMAPSTQSYTSVIYAWMKSSYKDRARKADDVLMEMLQRYQDGDEWVKPRPAAFCMVLNAYSKSKNPKALQRCVDIFELMSQVPVKRNSMAFASLQSAYVYSKGPQAETKIKELLDLQQTLYNQGDTSTRISVMNVNELLHFYAICSGYAQQANHTLHTMHLPMSEGGYGVHPDQGSYTLALIAVCRGNDPSVELVKGILDLLEQRARQERKKQKIFASAASPSVELNTKSYLEALKAMAKQGDAQGAEQLIQKVDSLYDEGYLDRPADVIHFTLLALAWSAAAVPESSTKCLNILAELKDRKARGVKNCSPSRKLYNVILECLTKAGHMNLAEQLLFYLIKEAETSKRSSTFPVTFSFNTVIAGYANRPDTASVRQAEAILDRFIEFYEEHPKTCPNFKTFACIIYHYCYSKDLDAPYRAEYALNKMISHYEEGNMYAAPTAPLFVGVIEKYARVSHPDAGTNADRLLRLAARLQIPCTTGLINAALRAWAYCGHENAGQQAEAHLFRMEEAYADGDKEMKPNIQSYVLALSAWTKTNSSMKAQRAYDLLRHFQQQKIAGIDIESKVYLYALVINACAFCNGHDDAKTFQIATTLFDEILDSAELAPSAVLFGWFIQSCGRLDINEAMRDAYINRAYVACKNRGMVNDFVVQRLKGAASTSLQRSLLGNE